MTVEERLFGYQVGDTFIRYGVAEALIAHATGDMAKALKDARETADLLLPPMRKNVVFRVEAIGDGPVIATGSSGGTA